MAKITRKKKVIGIALAIVCFLVLAFFGGRYVLYTQIRKTIIGELNSLKDQDIEVGYDHLEVDPWQGRLEFFQLSIKVTKDNPMHPGLNAVIPYVLVKGVDIIPFITNKTLAIKRISVQHANIAFVNGATLFDQDTVKKRKIELRNISVQHIDLPGLDLFFQDSLTNDTLAHLMTSVQMNNIFLKKQVDSLTWRRGEVLINNLAYKSLDEQYGYSAKKIRIGIEDRSLSVDSIRIKPMLTKNAFMKFKGKEITYINGVIPYLRIKGINWFVYPKPIISAEVISTTFNLNMYLDKRYPFIQPHERKLPTQILHDLPFLIQIDTILVKNSHIKYEEHPEEGDSSGFVFFSNLYATILMVHNNPKHKRDITMDTYSQFMGSGELNARFTFPFEPARPYTVSGTLQDMEMPEVNTMLGAAAKAKIESGVMKRLSFDFSYTPLKSNGEVELNYEDLKILTLRSNKKDEQKVSHLKSLLLNTFIIKKDMDEDVPEDKRKGEIEFYRDDKRSVFNYWWKSILSGLKSAYNLDKLPIGGNDGKPKKKKNKFQQILSDIF